MQNRTIKKSLVIGIIVLFIGVVFEPVLANEISISKTYDIEEECNICQPVSKLHLIKLKSLIDKIDKVEKYENILSLMYKLNPEIEEKYQEISNLINNYIETNYELTPELMEGENSTICFILLMMYFKQLFSAMILIYIYDFLDYYPVLHLLYLPLFFILGEKASIITNIILNTAFKKNCEWAGPFRIIEFNM